MNIRCWLTTFIIFMVVGFGLTAIIYPKIKERVEQKEFFDQRVQGIYSIFTNRSMTKELKYVNFGGNDMVAYIGVEANYKTNECPVKSWAFLVEELPEIEKVNSFIYDTVYMVLTGHFTNQGPTDSGGLK